MSRNNSRDQLDRISSLKNDCLFSYQDDPRGGLSNKNHKSKFPKTSLYLLQMELRKQSERMTQSDLWQAKQFYCHRCNQLEAQLNQKENYIQYLKDYQKNKAELGKFSPESVYEEKIHQLQMTVDNLRKQLEYTNDDIIKRENYELKAQVRQLEQELQQKPNEITKMHQEFIEQLEKDLCVHQKDPEDGNAQNKFVKSILYTVATCHPDNYFENKLPTLKQAWKWIKFVLADYMKLKRGAYSNFA